MAKSWRCLEPWGKTRYESRGEENGWGLENKKGEMGTSFRHWLEAYGLFPVNLTCHEDCQTLKNFQVAIPRRAEKSSTPLSSLCR